MTVALPITKENSGFFSREKSAFGDKKSAANQIVKKLLDERAAAESSIRSILDIVEHHAYAVPLLYCGANSSLGNLQALTIGQESQVFSSKNLEQSLKALDSYCWQKLMNEANLFEAMPVSIKDVWRQDINSLNTPKFELEAIIPTITTILGSRLDYFAARIDEVFRELSGEHVTNRPEGFTKRIILKDAADSSRKAEHITNLRNAVQVLLGNARIGEDVSSPSRAVLSSLQTSAPGIPYPIDGGALTIKVYRNNNVHIEMPTEIAIELNQILSHLYPAAIPNKFRELKKQRKIKTFTYEENLVSSEMVNALSDIGYYLHVDARRPLFVLHWSNYKYSQETNEAIEALFESIGLERFELEGGSNGYKYDSKDLTRIKEALSFIQDTRTMPNNKSYQYYSTNEKLGRLAYDLLEYDNPDLSVLEPQAGRGHLARLFAKESITCVEISKIHHLLLKAQGFHSINDDFLNFANDECKKGTKWDRIISNPPFSKGRALTHTEAALKLLKHDGVMVAILPATYLNKELFEGYNCCWHDQVFSSEFEGTNVSVAIVSIRKQA